MDIVTTVKSCLSRWAKGGDTECRSIVISPHCHPEDAECVDVLSTVYETLLQSTLLSWNAQHPLAVSSLVTFISDVLNNLPSSSSPQTQTNPYIIAFGEIIVDLIWTLDSALDEILFDAKQVIGVTDGTSSTVPKTEADDKSESILKASKAKEMAETDKGQLADIIKMLLSNQLLSPAVCRERLDMTVLTLVGLLPDKVMFEKKEIRTRTALFYKQNKFNLLREQSEGYSKLTTDLIASLGPPHMPATGLPAESLESILSRAQSAWERVVSLIGYFDLDPNRALDIILDIFSVNIATHWQFFLSLLSCSSWFKRVEKVQTDDSFAGMKVDEDIIKDPLREKSFLDILRTSEETADRSVMERQGDSQVLSQVLGFKFTYYQLPEVQETTPKGLYLAAALLIREGFLTLEELYPHLSPVDEDMSKLHQKYLSDVQGRISSSSNNLLAMAAPLESAPHQAQKTAPSPNGTDTKKPTEPKVAPPQKVMIVVALLSVGVLRPALAILAEFPWLVDVHQEIADLLLRVLKASISPLFEEKFKKDKERNPSFLQPRPRYGAGGSAMPPPRKPQLTLIAPPPPSTYAYDFVFFYPHWAAWVPLCRSMDDLINIIEPFMRFIGLHVSREPLFLTKLLRLGKIHLASTILPDPETRKQPLITESDHPVQRLWLNMARRYLLPALSMISGNAVCTVEVWNILKQYDTTMRWSLYGEWRDVTYKSHPELKAQMALKQRESKAILRRLSSQTVESLSGAVAKMAHSNPCIFFTNAVNQIQAYDNLADVVIQALRYATNMGFDILVFTILDALSNPHKDRVKEDGVYTSDWLQSLAIFTGALFRRYSSDLSPLLFYVVHQLQGGQTSEIVVLEKLILKMAGIEPMPSLSDAQITAMAGGPTLRIEAVASELRGAAFETSEVALKGTPRLGKALTETKLAFPILVQVVQQRQACVFKARDAHLKSMAYLFDATHGVLCQYLDLLSTPSALPLEDYRSMLPPLGDLGNLYGFSAPIAMQVIRPILNDAILQHAQAWVKATQVADSEAAEKRLKAALAAKRETSVSTNNGTEATPNNMLKIEGSPEGQQIEERMDVDAVAAEGPTDSSVSSPWIPELAVLFEDCKQIAPGNAYEVIGPGFYVTFWQMSSYDIYFPKDKYSETEKALQAAAELCSSKSRQAERSSDRSLRQSSYAHRNQRDRYLATVGELKKERAAQEAVYKFTTDKDGRLEREKKSWFSHSGASKSTPLINSLIEHCLQPRCLLSPMDADYCSRLIRTLHERGTPGFHTLMCYDKLLAEHVKVIIFSCSEAEARNYGRFLRGILKDLYEWHRNEKAYDASNRRTDGSTITLLPGLQKHWSGEGPSSPDDLLKWTDFKSFLKKCHRKLGRSFTECIEAGDFMHVYNAVLVLKEIINVFPIAAVNEVVGSSIDHVMKKLADNEERGDLKILAKAYYSSLKKRESIWAMPKPVTAAKATSGTLKLATQATAQPNDRSQSNNLPVSSERPSTSTSSGGPPTKQLSSEKPGDSVSMDRSSFTKLALESIPRPEVVKRVRPDSRLSDGTTDANKAIVENGKVASTPFNTTDSRAKEEQLIHSGGTNRMAPALESSTNLRKDVLLNGHSRPSTPAPSQLVSLVNGAKEAPQSPRRLAADIESAMPPPSAPSQTATAQGLRTNAKQQPPVSRDRASPTVTERTAVDLGTPRIRSISPTSRPGTRNASSDSRASGAQERDRNKSDKTGDALESTPSRVDRSTAGHRDVLHGRSERSGRDRIPGSSSRDIDRDSERDRDRLRERNDKDRDRERERDKGRERDRDSHRERDKDRDRDRDRERHRRDDKERDREQRKESRGSARDGEAQSDNGGSRADSSRHRTHSGTDDTLGKRRRPTEDESERVSKRGSRHRESRDDRSRRASEKESARESMRESDRRRKDREGPEDETRSGFHEKPPERVSRVEQPIAPPQATPLKVITQPPSAPRAMAAPSPRSARPEIPSTVVPTRERDRERNEKDRDRTERIERVERIDRQERPEKVDRGADRSAPDRGAPEREWKMNREASAVFSGSSNTPKSSIPASNSLRARIGDLQTIPPATNQRGGGAFSGRNHEEPHVPSDRGGDRNDRGERGERSERSERVDARKRTLAERERDTFLDSPLGSGTLSVLGAAAAAANNSAPPKRPRVRPRS